MAKTIGKNVNRTDTATVPAAFSIGSTTAVKILDAQAPGDQPRGEFWVSNGGNRALFVREYPAATDNAKAGIRIAAGGRELVVGKSELTYDGEISAIFESGGTNNVYTSLA